MHYLQIEDYRKEIQILKEQNNTLRAKYEMQCRAVPQRGMQHSVVHQQVPQQQQHQQLQLRMPQQATPQQQTPQQHMPQQQVPHQASAQQHSELHVWGIGCSAAQQHGVQWPQDGAPCSAPPQQELIGGSQQASQGQFSTVLPIGAQHSALHNNGMQYGAMPEHQVQYAAVQQSGAHYTAPQEHEVQYAALQTGAQYTAPQEYQEQYTAMQQTGAQYAAHQEHEVQYAAMPGQAAMEQIGVQHTSMQQSGAQHPAAQEHAVQHTHAAMHQGEPQYTTTVHQHAARCQPAQPLDALWGAMHPHNMLPHT